jgi:Ran GTPase-activating protein (RanGAP) involved in mRNA processing and transport
VKSLQEDMAVELEHLQMQYDEQRSQGIEKIRLKYFKNNKQY